MIPITLPCLKFSLKDLKKLLTVTAKRYREANKLPHQFRRAAWTVLTVEVYL